MNFPRLLLLPSLFTVFLNFMASEVQADPMSFRLAGNGGNCNGCEWLSAQGDITPDTPQVFREYIEANGTPYIVTLHSSGGSLLAGIELGALIRETGATTSIGETIQSIGEDVKHYEETRPGKCASACVFAFMGGVERWVGNSDLLGVHQFYSTKDNEMPSEVVQALAGLSLIHTINMGVDPRVIVAASQTVSDEIYWFSQEELSLFGLDTSASRTEPWRLEPYKDGLIINTMHHEGMRRSVSVTLFCRIEDQVWRLLISEENAFHAKQLVDGGFLNFEGQYPSRPMISVGQADYAMQPTDIEFQRISGDNILLSIHLPESVTTAYGQRLSFEPDFARYLGQLLRLKVELPAQKWMEAIAQNCI